jgi:hypothetical protein
VYKKVYLSRWRGEWEDLLTDRSISLRERLIQFYDRYTKTIFTREWIRIYLFAGLKGYEINEWWITFVEEQLLRRICAEMRREFDMPALDEVPLKPAETEVYWTYHGGIFYYGVRREVCRVPPAIDLALFIELTVEGMLSGLPAVFRRILDSEELK